MRTSSRVWNDISAGSGKCDALFGVRDQPYVALVFVVVPKLNYVLAVKAVAVAPQQDLSPHRQQVSLAGNRAPIILYRVLGQRYREARCDIKTRRLYPQYLLGFCINP